MKEIEGSMSVTEESNASNASGILGDHGDLSSYSAAIHTMPSLWWRWVFTFVVLMAAFGIVAGKYAELGLSSDVTGLTKMLGFLFVILWSFALFHVFRCERERSTFNHAWSQRGSDGLPIVGGTGGTAIYFQTLRQSLTRNQKPPLERMIQVLADRMHHTGHLVGLGANVLITLGLIGTIVGLLISMQGLSSATNELAATGEGLGMITSLQEAISGMGIAFYTTLFGAILGGVVIRVLHGQTQSWTDLYVSLVAESTDLELIPAYAERLNPTVVMNELSREVTKMTEKLQDVRKEIEQLGGPQQMWEEYKASTERLLTGIENSNERLLTGIENSNELLLGGMEKLGEQVEHQADTLRPVAKAAGRLMGEG
jgi:hypothetical protein